MTVIATLVKTKAWYLQSQISKVNSQVFVKTAINSNIAVFFLSDISSTKIAIPPSPSNCTKFVVAFVLSLDLFVAIYSVIL